MAATPLTLTRDQIRYANQGDIETILAIDEECFEHSWARSDFQSSLKATSSVVIVATQDTRVIGFMIYVKSEKNSVRILRIAITGDKQQRTVGTQMIRWLLQRETEPKTMVLAAVQEDSVSAQLFFKKLEFKVAQIIPEYFQFGDDTTATAYDFAYSQSPIIAALLKPRKPPRGPLTVDIKNRIKGHFKDRD